MAVEITLHDVNNAWITKNESTVELFLQLIDRDKPDTLQHRSDAYTFDSFISEINDWRFKQLSLEEQSSFRQEKLALLEGPNAEVPLSDKLKSHEFIMKLWQDNSQFSRQCLIELVAKVPLRYGPWKGIKALYKESELKNDIEIFGAIGARIDQEFCRNYGDINQVTIAYLSRRSWRYLRTLAKSFPITYPDAAVNFLKHYPSGMYGRYDSVMQKILEAGSDDDWDDRYNTLELWRRSPRPLFTLLESSQSEQVQEFAINLLKSEFRAVLRDTDPAWVVRLTSIKSEVVDEFIVWILKNTPRFELAQYKQLGLHEVVLKLLFSDSRSAVNYALDYARTNARDLEFDILISLLAVNDANLAKFALEILTEKDPRKDIGLEGFVKLSSTQRAYDFIVESLQKHFSPSELTPEWFLELLLSKHESRARFAVTQIFNIHTRKKLGLKFFSALLNGLQQQETWTSAYYHYHYDCVYSECIEFCIENLVEFDLNLLDLDSKKSLLYWPPVSSVIADWIDDGNIRLPVIDLNFLRALVYQPQWEDVAFIKELECSELIQFRQLHFNDELAESIKACMSDPRQFSARDIGFDWLLTLVKDDNPDYHDFATDLLLNAFSPEDFAETDDVSERADDSDAGLAVDFDLATFLFTGKLKTMTRKEAGEKVTQANGKILSTVSKNLDYLVIGDEGSPLYGEGKKGSKQVKAESLIESGAALKIISEAGFLQMLVSGAKTTDVSVQLAGCERLWRLLLSDDRQDAQIAKFALKYFRYHHIQIAKSIDDSIVDPGTEIPDEFLSLERMFPLFKHKSATLREFTLEVTRWELARWSPSIDQLMTMLSLPYANVRQFISNAIFAEDKPEHRFYRIDNSKFSVDSVYRLCDSSIPEAYEAGMMLVQKNDHHQIPERLFQLTETQNRKVRAFAIKQLWILYRDRGLSLSWSPNSSNSEQQKHNKGSRQSVSRPQDKPAEQDSLRKVLRKCLFEIPKGRITSNTTPEITLPEEELSDIRAVRLLPTSKAKLSLIETIRDIAIDDFEFAEYISPLFEEFKQSIGQSEQAACLVASTRIHYAHPSLSNAKENNQ
ncbi:hypothetical protein MNBD_GAMMA12-984 [hydrothermal vent metagenome]|uniref:BRCT domain-containing protein n=1 Tax=hydrothermal vent metagenome TaxID=652676 RepID=A0A3B0Y9Z8_9ZZZZ